MVKKVAVASTNPVKVRAVQNGFQTMFPGVPFEVVSLEVPSGVRDQPRSDQETLTGALNRAEGAAAAMPESDYWVGIEGGIQEMGTDLAAFAWVVVKSHALAGQGRTGTFFLPPAVADLIREGHELGTADDLVFGRSDSKRDNGAVGILTVDVIDRTALYQHAVILALIPFKNEGLYKKVAG
jgi:inosine/xanthosine triphosphatase